MSLRPLLVITAAMLVFAHLPLRAAVLVTFDFNDNLNPSVVDPNLSITNQAATNLSYPTTGTLQMQASPNNNADTQTFSFDVVIAPGFMLDITNLFVGQERNKRSNAGASLFYDIGGGMIEITETLHTPYDSDMGMPFPDFSADFDLTGLTGTVTFAYATAGNGPGGSTGAPNRVTFEQFTLNGTVVIPEPTSSSLLAGILFAGLAYKRRRRG